MEQTQEVATDIKRIAFWGMGGACLVYMVGWFINVMDPDSAQYASITREMLERGEYLTFTDQGREYLDKPPLIFWLSGISFKLFGINNIAFRIPAFLATLLTLYSTFRLASIFYDTKTGYLASLILATIQATFLINHDVRTDTNLICWFIFTLWQMAAFLETKGKIHFLLAFIGVALAMMAKGPIGLVAPGLGIFMHLMFKKDWKLLFNPMWIVGLVIVALLLLPMSYGLFMQFDSHPEKVVNGLTGVSGLRFYYWTQSFGRITGENVWRNNTGPFFLSHSTLWAFFPWTIFLVLGLVHEAKDIFLHVKGKIVKKEFLVFFGLLLPFIALSASAYQLPHYAFIVYPLCAIVTAKYIQQIFYKSPIRITRILYIIQTSILSILWVGVLALVWFCFAENNDWAFILLSILIPTFLIMAYEIETQHKLIIVTIISAIGINLILNSFFYPELLNYQAGSQIADKVLMTNVPKGNVFCYEAGQPWSLNFYTDSTIPLVHDFESLIQKKNILVYTKSELIADFKKRRPDVRIVHQMGDYPVTLLRMKFLNPATRSETLKGRCLLRL